MDGAVYFLDLMKAFDRVSHEALGIIMDRAGWPPVFSKMIAEIYADNKASVLVNGIPSPKFRVGSGTRQGCPLSPLLFTLVQEVFNQNIVCNPNFKGLEFGEHSKKVAAFADDTAVGMTSKSDIRIFAEVLEDYEAGTAMKVNANKSEAVLLGGWRNKPPKMIHYPIKEVVKYLGCPVGNVTTFFKYLTFIHFQ